MALTSIAIRPGRGSKAAPWRATASDPGHQRHHGDRMCGADRDPHDHPDPYHDPDPHDVA